MRPPIEDDRALLAKCFDGDRVASEVLVRRFSDLVYKTVQYALRARQVPFTGQDLEDLHSTVFLGLFERGCRKLRQYQGRNGCSLASWIRLVTVRIILNHLRKKGPDAAWGQRKRISIDELDHVQREEADAPSLMERAEQEKLVQGGIQTLTPRERMFVKLHFRQGLPVDQVARTMRISMENAYTMKHRAVQRLKAYVTSRGE